MFSWKERLYAFLLRRVLGPLLTRESLHKLHECLHVSVTEGSYVLTDVGLNAEYLSANVSQQQQQYSGSGGVRIVAASIRKLRVYLRLQEHNNNEHDIGATEYSRSRVASSLAWRALKLGSAATQQQPSVSLVVQVVLEGVCVTVEACPRVQQQQQQLHDEESLPSHTISSSETEGDEASPAKSFLSSYLEAALSSLRLSIDFTDLRVRVRSTSNHDDDDDTDEYQQQQSQLLPWIEVRAQSASYHDVVAVAAAPSDVEEQDASPSLYETVLHKAVEVTRMTVLTGSGGRDDIAESSSSLAFAKMPPSAAVVVALLEGTSRCSLRVIEYRSTDDDCDNNDETQAAPQCSRAQQDIQVNLNQKLNVLVEETSLHQIRAVAHSFARQRDVVLMEPVADTDTEAVTTTASPQLSVTSPDVPSSSNSDNDDEADFRTLDGIMKQYQEARMLAERKEVRGGILVPSFDSGGGVTFDTFFDANEQSFSRYSSVLNESILGAANLGADWIHTKLRFHVQEGGIKLAFKAAPESLDKASDEYVLLTFNEANLSSQLSARCSEHALSINHLELEDALKAATTSGAGIEIGTLLRFSPEADGDDDDDADLLVQAPCISLSVKLDNGGKTDSIDVELTLEPLEVSYQSAAFSKLALLLQTDARDSWETETTSGSQDMAELRTKTISVFASCASVAVSLPVSVGTDWGRQLFERSGYTAESTLTRKSALGLMFERVAFDLLQDGKGDAAEMSSELSVSCHNIFAYASSPVSQCSVFDQRIERFDIFAFCGRTEVDPCIPMSVRVIRCTRDGSSDKDDGDGLAVKSFPKVPPISSFKARQEDEDDDNRIDRVLSSSAAEFNVNSRKELRSSDPQSVMLSDVSTSDVVVSIHIPEIIGDLTTTELSVLKSMASSLNPEFDRSRGVKTEAEDNLTPLKRIALSINCDFLSLAVHGDVEPSSSSNENGVAASNSFSFMVKMDQFQGHVLADGPALRHARLLSHEVDFFEILDLCQKTTLRIKGCVDKRIAVLRQRGTCHSGSRATPILYRSHLFAPISRKSPCVLLDLLNVSMDKQEIAQKNIYFTIYDTTYRHSYDSRFLTRLASILPQGDRDDAIDECQVGETESGHSLMRTFLSVADCNFDYSSAPRFKTASRSIVRVGDLRISSNMMWPRTAIQAYTISLGDVSLYVCNSRYPYNFENRRLISAQSVFQPDEFTLATLGLPEDAEPDEVLRSMNYRTILTVDSIDAIIAVSNAKPRNAADPSVCATLTIGQVCMFACKDSFARFTSTIGELSAEMTAITDDVLDVLRSKSKESRSAQALLETDTDMNEKADTPLDSHEDLKKRSIIRPSVGTSRNDNRVPNFLLDGYDWTTIDSDECGKPGILKGEEQSARWYGNVEAASPSTYAGNDEVTFVSGLGGDETKKTARDQSLGPRIISHHFPLNPVSDPIGDGDMGVTKFAGSNVKPQIRTRLIVHDLAFRLRFFDGFDWPELLDEKTRASPRCEAFIIPEVNAATTEDEADKTEGGKAFVDGNNDTEKVGLKAKLMGDLLSGGPVQGSTFENIPLPEERGKTLKEQAEIRRLARRTSKFFQVATSGVSLRIDSMEESSEHRLVSCLNLKVQDMFLAETISCNRPIKMLGEWFNEQEHPRDSNDGLIMLKMVTWHPLHRISDDGDVMNDESKVGLKMLPLRCIIDQRAVAFARAFFQSGDDQDPPRLPPHLHIVPPPLFTEFRVRDFKLKVDYRPQKLDAKALRNGSVVELINLSPLDGMVLTLKDVGVENEVGFGAVISLLARQWVQDICSTQLLKFVTNSRPLEPITEVSGAAIDMVVLPWDAFKNGEGIQKALRSGAKAFSKTFVYEFFNLSSRTAEFIAGNASRASAAHHQGVSGGELLPSRPLAIPRHVLDAGPHAVESLSRGFQAANYKIVIVPYREYHRTGASGAVRSVLKGIPVAIAAPASGAAEALSFALLGARNQIRPDIRKEEEASMRGLHMA